MLKGDRLKNRRKYVGLSQKELCEKLGTNNQIVYQLESKEETNSKVKTLEKLADALNTSTDYLLGRTDIFNYDLFEITDSDENTVKVPVYGRIPAGIPLEAIKVDYGYVPVSKSTLRNKQMIGLKVVGDSMYPLYMEGDVILIEVTTDVQSGDDIVAFVGYDNEATLKRYHKKEDHIELEPLNREYPRKSYGKDDPPIRILGKVREIRREL